MRTIEDITTLDILVILPHRRPFVLIDRLEHYDSETTSVITSYTVLQDGVFVEGGFFQAEGLMENIAQACAARIGFYDWLHELPVKPGVIGSVKGLNINQLPKAGEKIFTHITPKAEALGVLLAEAVVKSESGEIIAQSNIKVAV